jgi:hypothetical protein
MSRRYLQRKETHEIEDPLENPARELSFQKGVKEDAEKPNYHLNDAGNDTRNTNQYVKLVNAHIQQKVSQLERIKEAQRKFEQEVDMFKNDPREVQQTQIVENNAIDVETVQIVRELSAIINRYGSQKIIKTLDQLLSGH